MVRIDEPCTERWDGMTGDDRRRFCDRCRHSVHDLSAMTRAEATSVLEGRGRVCVRYTTDGAGRVLHRRALAAGALLAASPALASSAPSTTEPGPFERAWEAAVEWWSGDASAPEAPPEPQPAPVDPAAEAAPVQVRHVTMGMVVREPLQVVGEAEIELAAGAAPILLDVACADGWRDRLDLRDRGTVPLGAGECTLTTTTGAPGRVAPVKPGDDLVCAADERTLTCRPR